MYPVGDEDIFFGLFGGLLLLTGIAALVLGPMLGHAMTGFLGGNRSWKTVLLSVLPSIPLAVFCVLTFFVGVAMLNGGFSIPGIATMAVAGVITLTAWATFLLWGCRVTLPQALVGAAIICALTLVLAIPATVIGLLGLLIGLFGLLWLLWWPFTLFMFLLLISIFGLRRLAKHRVLVR